MVYTSQLIEQTIELEEKHSLLDPTVVAAAQKIYRTYYHLHGEVTKTPIGVAIDTKTHRGQLLFTRIPILLPGECFIPLHQLESE